ncbi:MAG: hypothetical protein R3A52_01520 [Polyangiales bacterium]
MQAALWSGGNWNAMYNAMHTPMRVDIPSDARRVELYALSWPRYACTPSSATTSTTSTSAAWSS